MHRWQVTVQLTYTTEVWTTEQDTLEAHELAIDAEDPNYDTPHIKECVYLGEVLDENED